MTDLDTYYQNVYHDGVRLLNWANQAMDLVDRGDYRERDRLARWWRGLTQQQTFELLLAVSCVHQTVKDEATDTAIWLITEIDGGTNHADQT